MSVRAVCGARQFIRQIELLKPTAIKVPTQGVPVDILCNVFGYVVHSDEINEEVAKDAMIDRMSACVFARFDVV